MAQSETHLNYGVFLDFPSVTHYIRRINHGLSEIEFRKALFSATVKLGLYEDTIQTSSAGKSTLNQVKRTFEIGVADGLEFGFLDHDEAEILGSEITKRSLRSLDLVIFVHYRYLSPKTKKIASLRFDQYFLRIGFKGAVFTFFHVKGLKRTSPNEILSKLGKLITSK